MKEHPVRTGEIGQMTCIHDIGLNLHRWTTDLHIIWPMAQRYADEILRSDVVPCTTTNCDSFPLMHDDARPHTFRFVENMLETKTVQCMECPACRPHIILNGACHVHARKTHCNEPVPRLAVRELKIAHF